MVRYIIGISEAQCTMNLIEKKCYCYNNLNYTKICAILVKQIKEYVALFRFEIKQMNESKLSTKWFYL